MLRLQESFEIIGPKVAKSSHILLFSDFDGTLSPIANRPENAFLPVETKNVLAKLSKKQAVSIVIISGRSLEDIRARVGIPDLIYAGNHGLEINGPQIDFLESTAEENREPLRKLCHELTQRLLHIDGVLVENKGLTASVHYRMVTATNVKDVVQTVEDALVGKESIFRLTRGKKVCEIRPPVDWDKGKAVGWIKKRLGGPGSLTICLGDDITDEDAFAALPEGILIRVGRAQNTSAHYAAENPEEVREFLFWLADRA